MNNVDSALLSSVKSGVSYQQLVATLGTGDLEDGKIEIVSWTFDDGTVLKVIPPEEEKSAVCETESASTKPGHYWFEKQKIQTG